MPSYLELKKQIEALQKQAEEIRANERAGVILEIREKIVDYEITAADLGFKDGAPLAKKNVPIRYRDNNGNVWIGRGPRPRWLKAELEQGKSLEDFLVN